MKMYYKPCHRHNTKLYKNILQISSLKSSTNTRQKKIQKLQNLLKQQFLPIQKKYFLFLFLDTLSRIGLYTCHIVVCYMYSVYQCWGAGTFFLPDSAFSKKFCSLVSRFFLRDLASKQVYRLRLPIDIFIALAPSKKAQLPAPAPKHWCIHYTNIHLHLHGKHINCHYTTPKHYANRSNVF